MSFFKLNRETKTEDLKLSDYDQIWTKFCFLDETGSLNDINDPFFTVGILKLSQPYYLASKIDYERRKRNFHKDVNFLLGRLALAGVCRFDSRSNDLLQVVDLVIGAISYDLKLASGIIQIGSKYKRRMLECLKSNLGAETFVNGFRNRNFNIFVDKDMRLRLPLKTNEKGPSS